MKNKYLITLLLCLILAPSITDLQASELHNTPLLQILKKQNVTINVVNKSLDEILTIINQQSNIAYGYQEGVVDKNKTFSINVNNKSIDNVLNSLLSNTPYDYVLDKDRILIVKKKSVSINSTQQDNTKLKIAGKVIDSENKPVVGATVIIIGTSEGAITDQSGKFSINAKKDQSIEISYAGFESSIQKIAIENSNLVVKLIPSNIKIDEVVVTGYFTRKRESFTGAETTFTGKELRTISTGNLLNSLSVLDPSFAKVLNNDMGSNPNSVPDFEIRGAGSLKTEYSGSPNMPTFIMDGFEVSATKVFDLDPNRVKSMTILKDAAATAIYGSRAANGVVIIETIKPAEGRLRVSYNTSVNFEAADLSDYNLMNASEKLEYEFKSGLFDISNTTPEAVDDLLQLYNMKRSLVLRGNDTNWITLPVKKLGIGHKHTVTVEGGSESFIYGLDLYYSNKEGVMKGSNRDTYGGSIRLQYNHNKFRVSNYTSFDHTKSVNSPFGNFSDYTYLNPYYYPYNEDGTINKILHTYKYYDRGYNYKEVTNWYYNSILPSKNQSTSNGFINNLSLEYDIIQGLKLKTNLSLGVDNSRTDLYRSREHTDFDKTDENKGSYSMSVGDGFSYDANVTLSYFKEIKRHAIHLGAVYNIQESNSDNTSISVIGFPNPNMDHIGMGTGYRDGAKPSASYNIKRLLGAVANVGYTFDNKYLFDASIRSDASSLYGANNRWGTFWSIGIGWNLHKELFLKDSKAINQLKIRSSIGTTGGQNFSSYQAMSMYSYNDSYVKGQTYDGYGGALLIAFGNKNLKWQKTNKRNIGLDFGFLESRISGSFDYYNDLSKDMLTDVSIAPSLGFSSYKENLGFVKNSGYELSLRGTLIKHKNNGFRWNVMFNLIHNKNTLMEINNALTSFNSKQDGTVTNKPTVRYQEGLSVNTIWTNESLGIDPATGDEVFLDRNGKLSNVWAAKNYKPMGCSDPDVFGTFGTSIYYKGLEINAYFYYKTGGDNYNQTLLNKIENVNPNENGDRRILSDRWTKPGDVAKYKRISDVSNTYPTSRFVEKESYVQFQSLSISYDFDYEKLKKLGVERLRLSAIGNDIFTVSTIKMERGISYPFARTFSLSAQLTF